MSRFPIIEDAFWQYDWVPRPLRHQRIVLEIQDQKFTIYNVHPSHPLMTQEFFNPEFRRQEIADILTRLANENPPIILAGDFNMPDLSDDYRLITSHFIDSYREAGWGLGFTFPHSVSDHPVLPNLSIPPILRLDYLFHSADLTTTKAQVWQQSGGSDHLPLYVELNINEQGYIRYPHS